jgi:hypothetical protein
MKKININNTKIVSNRVFLNLNRLIDLIDKKIIVTAANSNPKV